MSEFSTSLLEAENIVHTNRFNWQINCKVDKDEEKSLQT